MSDDKPQTTPAPDRRAGVDRSSALDGTFSGPLAGLRRRIYLTYRYLGWRTLLFRVITFPLRFTPLKRRLRLRTPRARPRHAPRAGLVSRARQAGRHRDPELPRRRAGARRSSRASARPFRRGMARIIVADDASGPEHVAELERIAGIEVVAGERERRLCRQRQPRSAGHRDPSGRGRAELRRRGAPGWLACLQYAASQEPRRRHRRRPAALPRRAHPVRRDRAQPRRPRVVRPPLPLQARGLGAGRACGAGAGGDGSVHVCPSRGRSSAWACSTSATRWPTRTSTGACAPGRRAFVSLYFPAARLVHHESVTRGTEVGERERASQRLFWERWGDFFDARDVRTAEAANAAHRLRDRGHRRRRRAPRHLRAPQPPARPRPRGCAVHARRSAGLV